MKYKCQSCKCILKPTEIGLAYRLQGKIIKHGDYDFSDVKWIELGFNFCKKCNGENIEILDIDDELYIPLN